MSDATNNFQENIIVIDEERGRVDALKEVSSTNSSANHRSKAIVAAAASALLLAVASYAGSAATKYNETNSKAFNEATPSVRTRTLETVENPAITPFFGDQLVTHEDLGIEVSEGLTVKLIATSGERVLYTDGNESALEYHEQSDAAGVIALDHGYVYVTNSELGDGKGGVYGMYFDSDGNLLEYKALLTDTTDNCGGGLTPWDTWVSCEEYEDGQCWQVDPNPDNENHNNPQATLLGGNGGRYESVAVDNRKPDRPVFFTTEDHDAGAMRRFVANGSGWDALHSDGAEEETFLNIIDENTFEWTTDEKAARDSAEKYYPNSEGIQFHENKLYFMAKKIQTMFILDLDNLTYEKETTGLKFYGEGSFDSQPDQNLFGPTRKWIYFTEDGGDSPGIYARHDENGVYFTLFQGIPGGIYDGDETIGIALSPDSTKFYAGIQDKGVIFEFAREDGLPFE